MSDSKIIRRDVSNDPEAIAKAISNPEWRAVLIELGFTLVGFYEIIAPGFLSQEKMEERLSPADAATIFNAVENGEVCEILQSSDKGAFAMIDNFFGGHVLILITITEDGTIIDTTMKPVREPYASEKLIGVAETTFFNFYSQIAARIRRLRDGLPEIWSRSNRPKAGYHLELLETRSPKILWLRHQARLKEILKPNQKIRPHSTLKLYVCTIMRSEKIMEYIGKWHQTLGIVNGILSVLLISLFTGEELLILGFFLNRSDLFLFLFLSFIPNMLLMYLIMLVGFSVVRTSILPNLPGPKLESVPELMKQVTLN